MVPIESFTVVMATGIVDPPTSGHAAAGLIPALGAAALAAWVVFLTRFVGAVRNTCAVFWVALAAWCGTAIGMLVHISGLTTSVRGRRRPAE